MRGSPQAVLGSLLSVSYPVFFFFLSVFVVSLKDWKSNGHSQNTCVSLAGFASFPLLYGFQVIAGFLGRSAEQLQLNSVNSDPLSSGTNMTNEESEESRSM
jgi:hypothetical protein